MVPRQPQPLREAVRLPPPPHPRPQGSSDTCLWEGMLSRAPSHHPLLPKADPQRKPEASAEPGLLTPLMPRSRSLLLQLELSLLAGGSLAKEARGPAVSAPSGTRAQSSGARRGRGRVTNARLHSEEKVSWCPAALHAPPHPC